MGSVNTTLYEEVIIIKKLLTITLSILMIGSMAAGCGKKNASVKDTTTVANVNTDSTSDAAKSTDSSVVKRTETQNNSNISQTNTTKVAVITQHQEQSFYGQWKIIKLISFGPVSTYGSEDIKKMVGKIVTYSDLKAQYGTAICENPYYKKTNFSITDFETSNKIKFSSLQIKTKSIDQINVLASESSNKLWDSAGSVFYLKDQNTLILFDGGAYFELVKVAS